MFSIARWISPLADSTLRARSSSNTPSQIHKDKTEHTTPDPIRSKRDDEEQQDRSCKSQKRNQNKNKNKKKRIEIEEYHTKLDQKPPDRSYRPPTKAARKRNIRRQQAAEEREPQHYYRSLHCLLYKYTQRDEQGEK